ncbi:MAG TPA: SDR family NAD(P)-dependent oxidoreductase [Taishania sp.]|nr:SDR family NAD(P)-dependent oxidoreductase [Taishania sp.]
MKKTTYALVTGASSGIGLKIANTLALKKYNLLLVSNQNEELQKVGFEISQTHQVECKTLCLDLANTAAAQEIFNYCEQQQISIEVLVNNAGMLVFSEVTATDKTKVNTILQLHMCTPTLLCRLFGEEMKKMKKGYILNVSSISSVMPYPGISLYGPTKTFMRYFTRAFRSEMKIYNVHVTCLLPGATETGLYDPNKVNLKLAKRTGIMQTSEFVSNKAINALFKNKAECIPGIINKLTVWFLPLLPSWLIFQIHKNTNLIQKGNQALDK